MSSNKTKKVDLEKAFTELEALIDKMESKQLNLEESLKCFEQGIKLIQRCQKELKTAEQKIQKFTLQNQQIALSDFYSDSQDEGI